MPRMRLRYLVLTLTGSAQQVSTSNVAVRSVSLQPGAANAAPVYVGDSTVTAAAYGVRLPAAAAGEPPAPFTIEGIGDKEYSSIEGMPLSAVWVIGTNTEKLHVSYVAAERGDP